MSKGSLFALCFACEDFSADACALKLIEMCINAGSLRKVFRFHLHLLELSDSLLCSFLNHFRCDNIE